MNLRLGLYELAARYRLDGHATQRLQELAGLHDEPAAAARWLPRGLAVLAAALGGLGLLLWVAANWSELGRVARFAVLQGTLAATGLGAAALPRARVPLGLLALLSIGGLWAYFGQTYQTGADAWQLFALWAAPGLLVGGVTLGMGLYQAFELRGGSLCLMAVALGVAGLVERPWLRVLLGAAAAWLLMLAIGPTDPWGGGARVLVAQWWTVHVVLLPLGAGWTVVVLAGLAWLAGMTFMLGGTSGGALLGELVQGDYLRLNFRLPDLPDDRGDLLRARRPYVIARRDARGVATLLRTQTGATPLAPGELRIELTPIGGRWSPTPGSSPKARPRAGPVLATENFAWRPMAAPCSWAWPTPTCTRSARRAEPDGADLVRRCLILLDLAGSWRRGVAA